MLTARAEAERSTKIVPAIKTSAARNAAHVAFVEGLRMLSMAIGAAREVSRRPLLPCTPGIGRPGR
jgi:hypothetical protein